MGIQRLPIYSVLIVVILSLGLSGCSVGHRITRLDQVTIEKSKQGAFYALPRTVVVATFSVQKTETSKGIHNGEVSPCFEHLNTPAEFLTTGESLKLWQVLGLPTGDIETGASYKVKGTPQLSTVAEPDPKQIFHVDLDSSAFTEREIALTYGPLGVLTAGTSSATDRRLDIGLATLQTVITSASGFRALDAVPRVETVDQNALATERFCQGIAKRIYANNKTIRDLKVTVKGDTLDEKQAQWIVDRLREENTELKTIFLRSKKTVGTFACAVAPEGFDTASPPSSIKILAMAPSDGFYGLSNSDVRISCFIPPDFQASSEPTAEIYCLDFERYEEQPSEVLRGKRFDQAFEISEPQGFYYRVPALVRVQISKTKEGCDCQNNNAPPSPLSTEDLVIAQAGIVAALPAQSTYQTKYQITLDPATGALKTLNAGSKAIDPKLITATGDSIAGFLGDEADRKKAEALAGDELTLLEREAAILEAQVAIQEANKKLGND